MKTRFLCVIMLFALMVPSISLAKGIPLFFQTGDELFEIEGAPEFEDGYSIGYACDRFAVFGADIWTWDCELMAINIEEFATSELGDDLKEEYSQKFSLSDRKRNIWNKYGAILLIAILIGGIALRARE